MTLYITGSCSVKASGVFLGQWDDTMAPMRAQGYYDPIAKTKEERGKNQGAV